MKLGVSIPDDLVAFADEEAKRLTKILPHDVRLSARGGWERVDVRARIADESARVPLLAAQPQRRRTDVQGGVATQPHSAERALVVGFGPLLLDKGHHLAAVRLPEARRQQQNGQPRNQARHAEPALRRRGLVWACSSKRCRRSTSSRSTLHPGLVSR